MTKKYLIYATSLMALAGCQSDDYLGNNPGNKPDGAANTAILFSGNANKITRATSNNGSDAATMLDKQFKVYGVKAATTEKNYQKVFNDYIMWYEEAGKTTTNTNGWEYVGESSKNYIQGNNSATLGKDQTIKYWDYSSANYHFVAGSPVSAFTFAVDESTNEITSATITGLKGHITANAVGDASWTAATAPAPVYVAEPKVVAKADYNKVVQFNFVRQQSKVRVGIYETIPGYKISEIKFYAQNGTATSSNVILTSATADYFVSTASDKTATGTITYDWTSDDAPTYTFAYTGNDLTKAQNWYGGEFKKGIPATTSAETEVSNLYGVDKDMESTGYFTVIPTATGTTASALLIKCDYTLTSEKDESGETIKVKGATAAIPAAFGKWDVNTLYTYIFKISDNTNGTTGTDSDPAGLYPITFDAVVAESAEATMGTTTTVTTPSITTTQEGSVTTDGIKYVANKAINVTVTNAKGEVQSLSQTGEAVNIKVFKLSQERTEADLQIAEIAKEELKNALSDNVTVESNVLSFTPSEAGTYAIQYLTTAAVTADNQNTTPAVYTYKVVKVEKAAEN